MLRFGNITEIDADKCYARVTFIDDGIVSAPLQICVMGAISNKYFHIFDINEQVACLMDDNSDEGVILGAIFNNNTKPDGGNKDVVRVKFSDNSSIEYNRSTHEYNIDVKGKINIKSDSEINLETITANVLATNTNINATTVNVQATTIGITGETTLTGNLTVTGTVTASVISAPIIGGGGVTLSGGNVVATGNISTPNQISGGVVSDGTVILGTHIHGGVTTGTGSTAPPTP